MPTKAKPVTEVHVHFNLPRGITPFLNALLKVTKMNMTELATALDGVSTSLGTVGAQLSKATEELVIALANQGSTTAAVDAALAKIQGVAASLKTASQGLDDLNADLPTP